jgi:hypothetical protein
MRPRVASALWSSFLRAESDHVHRNIDYVPEAEFSANAEKVACD